MGYTTKFAGEVWLSRQLTLAEAKTLLELWDDVDKSREVTGIDAYMQWVPTETLDAIVWDGNEKFYKYAELMQWLCGWLLGCDIEANGELLWSGEDVGDVGRLIVQDNQLRVISGKTIKAQTGKPLTMARLAEMALDQVTRDSS